VTDKREWTLTAEQTTQEALTEKNHITGDTDDTSCHTEQTLGTGQNTCDSCCDWNAVVPQRQKNTAFIISTEKTPRQQDNDNGQ